MMTCCLNLDIEFNMGYVTYHWTSYSIGILFRSVHQIQCLICGVEVDIKFTIGHFLRSGHRIKNMISDLEVFIELKLGDVA